MDIRFIAFGMLIVLAALFIGARYFIPHEKNRSRAEAKFAKAALNFKSQPSESTYKECVESARCLPHLKNKSEEDLNKYLATQGITLS
jgi:cbb3-type cytochrome oxidase subunit 3